MKKLLLISLAISITGIFALLLISQYQTQELTGKITSIREYGDFKIIILDKNQTITCSGCSVKINQTIKVTGKIITYNNKKEIEAEKIEIIN